MFAHVFVSAQISFFVWHEALCDAQECLLGGLQSVDDSELPMLTSDFYSKHMLRLKPDGECFSLIDFDNVNFLPRLHHSHAAVSHS